ncbi:hypothetical protein J6590_037838 [Homalodisca vitripennis]|nr:hypothetical protein J6590_037838 [Homalodisca vitripennis]
MVAGQMVLETPAGILSVQCRAKAVLSPGPWTPVVAPSAAHRPTVRPRRQLWLRSLIVFSLHLVCSKSIQVLTSPSVAQLVERWTVEATGSEKAYSLKVGRIIRLSVSRPSALRVPWGQGSDGKKRRFVARLALNHRSPLETHDER